MRDIPGRAYFTICLAFGRLLRGGRYSAVRIAAADDDAPAHVRKKRLFYAPLLVWLGAILVRILDTGMRVLPQRAWVERERLLYDSLYDCTVRTDGDGVLVLPFLAGNTLAALLEDPSTTGAARHRAIESSVRALIDFHRRGFTHGDAMAENVMVDLDAGVARWFDFETVHDSDRPIAWRRADDVRALVATCVLRSPPEDVAATLALILDVYADETVTHLLAATFATVWQRPLSFHLGQAGLSFEQWRALGRRLEERAAVSRGPRP